MALGADCWAIMLKRKRQVAPASIVAGSGAVARMVAAIGGAGAPAEADAARGRFAGFVQYLGQRARAGVVAVPASVAGAGRGGPRTAYLVPPSAAAAAALGVAAAPLPPAGPPYLLLLVVPAADRSATG